MLAMLVQILLFQLEELLHVNLVLQDVPHVLLIQEFVQHAMLDSV